VDTFKAAASSARERVPSGIREVAPGDGMHGAPDHLRRTRARLLAPVALSLLFCGGETAIAVEPSHPPLAIRIDRADDGRGVAVEFAASLAAPPEAVERALADVGAWPDWVPRVKAAHAIGRSDAAALFETTLGFPWPIGDVRELVAIRRDAVGPGARLSWAQVHGQMRRNDGSFTLVPLGAGRTELRYTAHFQFKNWVPLFLFRIAERGYAPWFVDSLQRRARQVAATPSPPPPTGPASPPVALRTATTAG
jgi:hypothetical protein